MNDILVTVARLSVPTFIVSSMLSMGLAIKPSALVAPLRNVRLVSLALIVNFFITPAIAYALTRLVPLERPHAIGLLLLSMAAGAPFLPKLAQVTHVDVSLVVTLMVLLTAGTIFFMPFELPLLMPGFNASPLAIARPLVVLMALPLIAAMIVGSRAVRLAEICRPILTAVANLSVVVVLVLFVGLNLKALWDVVGSGAIAVSAVFTVLAYIAGVVMAGPQPENRAAMGLASSTRNVAAALPVASLGGDPKVIIMLLVGTLTSLIVTLAAVRIRRRHGRESAHHEDIPINPQVARK